ncbi:zinc finger CCCH-type antiviral protein 1-like [Sceloporus undulatus]|uniref:zinc finger CCCH-type antiviral protein 1-like n=1 Tax=Sceloporus undulatus TaxID=8520 RepID=UPI001C4A771C|nr:zinc finger CCCH-type antiviral protein 1-like [Sceloporus undulatus]
MADPAVCGFITKLLCSSGGCSTVKEILPLLGLPEHQLVQILQDSGQERFLVIQQKGGPCQVLAVSPVRLCRAKECSGCQHLHICKNYYIKGRCFMPTSGRGACKYSHDVLSEENRKILKEHGLSGLNENELRVLLLQNDPFLLPEVCNAYNKGGCNQQDNCTRLHICRYFLRGTCRFPQCKRSHCFMEPKALKLLLAEGVDDKTAFNIQTICDYRTATLVAELEKCKSSSSSHKPEIHLEKSNAGNERKSTLEQSFDLIDFGNTDPSQDETIAHGTTSHQKAEKEKTEEICLYYIFRFCKHKNNCSMIHYHLPYRWQINGGNGWNDLSKGEEIEKAYCDPSITSLLDLDISFKTMTCSTAPIRRLSTPSSVTKPAKFLFTTKWLWYWKNDVGQWVEYGTQDGKIQGSNLGSDDLENLFLANPDDSIHFNAGSQNYEISFKEMTQRNMMYLTKREVRRRPKFVSSEDVKAKKGYKIAF